MTIKDVSAATMYDVVHDNQYRKTWDVAMSESYDIARLSANADVGYYSCKDSTPACVLCPCESDPPRTPVDSVSPALQEETLKGNIRVA